MHSLKLIQLLNSENQANQVLALSICEGGGFSEEVRKFITARPHLTLLCLERDFERLIRSFRFLYLRRCSLQKLPASFSKAESLLMLDLAYNQLSAFPEEILTLTQLKKLRLHHNQIQTIPPQIARLNQLEELVLEDNPLTDLPTEMKQLTQLKRLKLARNPISEENREQLRASLGKQGVWIEFG